MNYQDKIAFILDDKMVSIDFKTSQFTPTTTLLNYLRNLPNHKGVKEGCAEGDCGACTVVVAELVNDEITYKAFDSCLVFLPMVHGKQVITVENLGDNKHLHPVQKVMVEKDGSQCGYCTPGFVMSLFALYKNEQNPTRNIVNDYLTGNLCRCTGYRPIIDAAMAVTEHPQNDQFDENKNVVTRLLKSIDTQHPLVCKSEKQKYIKPFRKEDALTYLRDNPDALIVSGGTDVALRVTKKKELLPHILDISAIAEYNFIRKERGQYFIGSGTSLDDVLNKLGAELPALAEILKVFGSKQIRNIAKIGGNIGSASPIGDTLPLLMAYKATVVLQSAKQEREIALENFITGYRQTQRQADELIAEIRISNPRDKIIKMYKISKRKDLDISTVSAAFCLKLQNNTIEKIDIFYGGMAAMPKRALATEAALKGKSFSEETFVLAKTQIEKDFSPISDARSSYEGRLVMARNLLIKFWDDINQLNTEK